MDDCLIPSVSQLHSAPSSLIQDSLPNMLISISRAIHNSSIAEDDDWDIRSHSDLCEDIFEGHLQFNEVDLETDC
jgi:hypothetical protein